MSAVSIDALTPPKDRLQANLDREFGPVVRHWLAEPSTEDIALNPDGKLWVKCESNPWVQVGEMPAVQASSLLGIIAAMSGAVLNNDSPFIQTELPGYAARFEGIRFPVVSQPTFSIRKIAGRLHTLDEYVERGIVAASHSEVLRAGLRDRKNIVLAGGPGSGKTTLLNALIQEMTTQCPNDRIALIEDTLELRCVAPNHLPMRAAGKVTILHCLKSCLRVRPCRIIVGEVRGEEALTLLKALNTGQPGGLATVHSSSALGALTRLERLAAEATRASRVQELIGEAVDMVVFVAAERDTERYPAGRRVQEVLAVHGFSRRKYETEVL